MRKHITDQPQELEVKDTPMAGTADASLEPIFVTPVQRDVRVVEQGDATSMYRSAAALHANAPMSLGVESKADRGRFLRTGHPCEAVKQSKIELPLDVTMATAFRSIMDGVLEHLMANQPATAAGDIEGVHQMRIAIRRIRALLMLFQPHIEPHAAAAFTDALRKLGRIFGEARDWDVFCTEMLAAAEEHGMPPPLLDLLRKPAEAKRTAAHARVTAALDALLLTATVLGLAQWELSNNALLVDLAPDLLRRLDHKVRHRGRQIAKLDFEGLHKVRKSLKKLRYSIEFLSPLLTEKDFKSYLHRCKALLKQFGALNDGVVAVALAEQLGGERPPELAPAVAALAEWAAAKQSHIRRQIEEDWAKLLDERLPH
jgi:triphosphatase